MSINDLSHVHKRYRRERSRTRLLLALWFMPGVALWIHLLLAEDKTYAWAAFAIFVALTALAHIFRYCRSATMNSDL